MSSASMRAVTRREYGGVSAIRLESLPRPAPGPGQVLVQVRAAGLDRAVLHLLTGTPYVARAAFGVRRPQQPIMGGELAGEVVALGPEVNDFAIGQRVFGTCRTAFAEYALARADQLAATPAGVSDEFAATLGISGGTAHQAVCRHGQMQAGQQVLILGASGGVGSFAVQIAAHLGATVTGVCSQAKTEFVTGLGAQRAVDYRRVEVGELGQRFDVIIDIAGNRPLSTLRRGLTPRGTLVIVGAREVAAGLAGCIATSAPRCSTRSSVNACCGSSPRRAGKPASSWPSWPRAAQSARPSTTPWGLRTWRRPWQRWNRGGCAGRSWSFPETYTPGIARLYSQCNRAIQGVPS